jgi:hypothetical protein
MASTETERSIPIDTGQRAWLRRNAPQALSERNRDWFIEQGLLVGELLLVALTGLVGLLLLGWSAEAGLACLLLGMVTRTLGDVLKMLVAGRAVMAMARAWNHTHRVWVITRALSSDADSYSSAHVAKWNPGAALLVDLLLGAVGVLLLARAGGLDHPEAWAALAADRMWLEVTVVMLLAQIGGALWVALQHAGPPKTGPAIVFNAGLRGLGLFAMAVLVLLFGGEGIGAWWTLLAIQAALLLIGASAAWGLWSTIDETRFLRAWLALDREIRERERAKTLERRRQRRAGSGACADSPVAEARRGDASYTA